MESETGTFYFSVGAITDADTSAWEREIDQLVYGLYDLTPDEVALVEGGGQR